MKWKPSLALPLSRARLTRSRPVLQDWGSTATGSHHPPAHSTAPVRPRPLSLSLALSPHSIYLFSLLPPSPPLSARGRAVVVCGFVKMVDSVALDQSLGSKESRLEEIQQSVQDLPVGNSVRLCLWPSRLVLCIGSVPFWVRRSMIIKKR